MFTIAGLAQDLARIEAEQQQAARWTTTDYALVAVAFCAVCLGVAAIVHVVRKKS